MLKVSIKDLDSKMENIIKDVKISRHTIDVKINCRLDRSNSESEDYLKKIIKELRLFKHLTQIRMISISKEIIGNKREIVYRLFFDTWVDEIFDKKISPSDLDDLLASRTTSKRVKSILIQLKEVVKKAGGKDYLLSNFETSEECYSYLLGVLKNIEEEVFNMYPDAEVLSPAPSNIMDYCDSILPSDGTDEI